MRSPELPGNRFERLKGRWKGFHSIISASNPALNQMRKSRLRPVGTKKLIFYLDLVGMRGSEPYSQYAEVFSWHGVSIGWAPTSRRQCSTRLSYTPF